MAEYIKREDAIKRLRKAEDLYRKTMESSVRADMIAHCVNLINDIPAADVLEKAHGEWLNFYGEKMPLNKRGETTGESYCSMCKMFLMASDEYECYGNFCSHCGADMRKNETYGKDDDNG